MATLRFAVLSVTVLLALLEIGSCHRCYECTTAHDQSCADPYTPNKKHFHECIMDGQCGKMLVETPDGKFTIRQCINPLVNCKTIINVTNALATNEKVKYCSTCDGDLCNGGTSISSSIPLYVPILVFFATCLYYK